MRIYLIRKVCKNYIEKKVLHDYYVYLKYNYFNCPQIITTIKHYSFVFKLTKELKFLCIKTTIRYHFTPTRIIRTKSQTMIILLKMWRNQNLINPDREIKCCIYFGKPPGTSSNDLR